MTGRVKKPAAPKKKAKGYKMPAPIANGEIIHDTIMKKKWRIGPSIGVGGFGEIYSACDHDASPKKGSNYPFVIKIEPHENGPLFVEKHFYVRNANKDDSGNERDVSNFRRKMTLLELSKHRTHLRLNQINFAKFAKTKKLSTFGMPTYFGNGSHVYKGEKYRYLVLERYGQDLWTLFKECGRSFPVPTVFQIGLQMLEILEYIHSKGYVHADIKGANILLGLKKGTENQAYLVDFGLAARVTDKEFKPDPKCAHNGTIEYTSRDAHLGVATMRGDLEILAYNMLQWILGVLPWETKLANPRAVQDHKETFMKDVRSNVDKAVVPDDLIKFLEYIKTLKPKDQPDYTKCRHIFESYLKTAGKTRNSKLEFTPSNKGKATKATRADTGANDGVEVTDKVPKKRNLKESGNATKRVAKRGKPSKAKDDQEDEHCDIEIHNNDNVQTEKKNMTATVNKTRSPKKLHEGETDINDSAKAKQKKSPEKVGKKGSPKENVDAAKKDKTANILVEDSDKEENCENETPNSDSIVRKQKVTKKKITAKRKSSEPAVLASIKRTKLAPRATPPAKKNHANIATQTSGKKVWRSPRRQVSFDSPVCQVMGDKKPEKISKNDVNSSGDIFEDSFVIDEKKVKVKPKKRLIADEEITIKRVVKKTITTTKIKPKSWRDANTIVNGASPPSN